MLWLLEQLRPFILTLLIGLIAGLVFQFYQCSMSLSSCGKWLLYLLDFLVWIVILILVFITLLLINQGEIRVYILLALFTGIIIYFRRIAPLTRGLVCRIARVNGRFVRSVGRKALMPWPWLQKRYRLWQEKMRRAPGPDDDEEQ